MNRYSIKKLSVAVLILAGSILYPLNNVSYAEAINHISPEHQFLKTQRSTLTKPPLEGTIREKNISPLSPLLSPLSTTNITSSDWPTYLYDAQRQSYNSAESALNTSTIGSIKQNWAVSEGSPISSQPVVVNNIVYWGSWDGLEHASDVNGNRLWETNLGVNSSTECNPPSVGVASTATIANININGVSKFVDIVGGGDGKVYTLDALTGTVLWSTQIAQTPDSFIWSSPGLYNNSIYIGKSSFGDCPLVQGQIVQLNASTGAIQHIFRTIPSGCTGASVWGSPAIDKASGKIYFATGNSGFCSVSEPLAYAVVELNSADLSLVGSWQVTASQISGDSDFGSTPTLFYGSVKGVTTPMVGVASKNGFYYAFARDNLTKGPVWEDQVAIGGDCPDCGDGSLSAAGWDNNRLYIAGGKTTINNVACKGTVRAVHPGSGVPIWQYCLEKGPVLAAVSVIHGVVIVTDGNAIDIINASSGSLIKEIVPPGANSVLDSPASISNGKIYVGDLNGNFYQFG